MAYRDPLEAIRHRIAKAREQVAVREERITPTLLERLPGELVLEQFVPAREATEQEADGVESLQALDEALARYVELLDRVIATAPELAEEYNLLPTTFPERLAPRRRYVVPDIYSKDQAKLRKIAHETIGLYDNEPEFHDTRTGYFDRMEDPYLVDACFRALGAPLRVHVLSWEIDANNSARLLPVLRSHHSVLTTMRPSAPSLRLQPEGFAGTLKKWLRLARDVQLGSAGFDDTFVVDGSEDAARLLLKPEVCEALLKVAEHSTPTLEVADGLARLDWDQEGHVWGALEGAVEALAALRETPPTVLLK